VLQFFEEGAINMAKWGEIVTRHGLGERWEKFQRQFLE